MFQFHEGPIKTYIVGICLFIFPRFNSMKVRLKPDSINAFGANVVFQFHEGPIKTVGTGILLILILVSIP